VNDSLDGIDESKIFENGSLISVLSETGDKVVGDMPSLDDTSLLSLYAEMFRSRRIGERMINLQRQGRIHTTATMAGEEAAIVGSLAALGDLDWVAPSYRERWALTQFSPERLLPDAVSLATQLPYAVGLAWGLLLKKKKNCVLAYFGEGSSSEGDFYEAGNLAGVVKAPLIFFCRNNGWAISVPTSAQTAADNFAIKAKAFGFPGVRVDGMDVLAVWSVTRSALERARRGHGPTLIEAVSYRYGGHTTADDPQRYRSQEELDLWQDRDPLKRFRNFLITRNIWDASLEERITLEANAWAEAKVTVPLQSPRTIFDHVFDELTPRMRRQQMEMQELINGGKH